MNKLEDNFVEIQEFLVTLYHKKIISFDFARGSYKCRAKDSDIYLEIIPETAYTPIHYYKGATYISKFQEFFELLHPEVKKHFIYHLDLFQKLETTFYSRQ